MKIHIRNGRLIDPKNKIDAQCDVYIAAGKIVGIQHAPKDFVANQTIDASGLIVSPGFVDLSARLREPGSEYSATLVSELNAAAAGGVTSLACTPDTQPVLDEPGLVEMLKYRAKQLNLAHVYPLGALTRQLEGKLLTEMCKLTEAGCVGFSQADHAIIDTQVLWRACEYASTFGFTLFLRAEDDYLAKNGVAHDGEIASRLGLKGIPSAAEGLAIASILRIAHETNTKIHLCRLSTAEGVNLVREAKKQGVQVTADVSAQHLHLTDLDIGYFNAHAHLKPPLRSIRDKDALCQGLKDGTIDAICSDHTPVNDDAKLLPFAESEAGATGLELLLPLALKWANNQKLDIAEAIAKITDQSAQILGINSGHLSIGSDADITIFNPDQTWKVMPDQLKSQGKNTPFLGLEMTGKVQYTLLHGQITYQDESN
ncbi:dihydroorotase [Methylotenera versatilis]|uniref:dihydroorotase n=1 Tax=Methylotenera versatilis TaxID=1055487 RepID=UPI00064720E0|nr:dihydroorotase [Methylotenera versatilis]